MESIAKTAKALAKSPLGIIALFIALVYGLATVGLFGAGDHVRVLVWFLVSFPVLVLAVFVWLLTTHPDKLYAPGDYEDEEHFMEVATNLWAASRKSKGQATVDSEDAIQKLRRMTQSTNPTRILWVDDRPKNNAYERRAFEAVGLEVLLALSTDEALRRLSDDKHFGAVISDMGRKEGPREGYVLLDALRGRGVTTPLVFYSSSNAPEHKAETIQHGGQACTNDPNELFEIVLDLLGSQP